MGDYKPTIAIPPCETFQEVFEDRGWDKKTFILETGISEELFEQIYNSLVRYDRDDVSLLLQRVFEIPQSFWVNLEVNYQETLERLKSV